MPSQEVSPGAKRQKAFRDRMTRMGMTIPRIYMTESEQALVREFLRRHRSVRTEQLIEGMDLASMNTKWTTPRLFDALREHTGTPPHLADIRLHDTPSAIELSLSHYDHQPVQLVVSGHQIFMAAALCDTQAVKDAAAFNEACLRLGPNMPLSNVGLVGSHYILFGQLSAHSPLANIVEELDVMGQNAIDALGELSHLIG